MSRTLWAALGGAVVGAAVVVVALIVSGGGSGKGSGGGRASGSTTTSGSSTPAGGATTSTTAAGPSDPGARQLLSLLTAAGKLSFHATYQTGSAQAKAVLELWRSPPSARLDLTESGNGVVIQTTQITDGASLIACQRPTAQTWTCVKTALGTSATRGASPTDVVFGNLSRFLGETSYLVSSATIADRPATCFTGSAPLPPVNGGTVLANPPRLCTTASGIPLLIDVGDGAVTATVVDDTIPSGIFTPPAQPVGG